MGGLTSLLESKRPGDISWNGKKEVDRNQVLYLSGWELDEDQKKNFSNLELERIIRNQEREKELYLNQLKTKPFPRIRRKRYQSDIFSNCTQ